MPKAVYAKVLRRACDLAGGVAALRARLRVGRDELDAWMRGEGRPPDRVFLEAVDIVTEASTRRLRDAGERSGARGPAARAIQSHRTAADLIAESVALLGESERRIDRELEASLLAGLRQTGAARGNIQVVTGDVLLIRAQVGFSKAFLEHFARVPRGEGSVCGAAWMQGRRVVVADVAANPLVSAAAREALLAESVHAVQSTPVVSAVGSVIGMYSTHYDRTGEPDPEALALIDELAREVTARLDR